MDRDKTKRVELKIRSALRVGLVLFLLFPFIFLFTQFKITEAPDLGELWWAFKNSALQAFFSALCSLILGLWVALGLLSLKEKSPRYQRLFEGLCLLPNFLPALFILLSVLNTLQPFPMGIVGIVIIHTLMNFGLVAVLLSTSLESRMGSLAELAYVEGASKIYFFRKAMLPLMKKEIFLLGLFVFIICFGSFAVPLVVGGGRGTTLEVLIYEKIRLSHEWGQAVLLAFIQSSFIFLLSFLALHDRHQVIPKKANLSLLRYSSGLIVLGFISAFYIFGYLQGVIQSFDKIGVFIDAWSEVLTALLGSLIIGLSVGGLCFLGLMLIALSWPKAWFARFLSGYVAPSTSLACFCLLIIAPNEGFYSYIKIPVALTLLSLTGLYRMGWQSTLQGLESQMTVAYSMGARPLQIFKDVVFPQVITRAGVLSGIAAVWACGDFAVSRILAHKDLTVAMMTETLMAGYRLSHAILLSVLIIVVALVCYFIFTGGSRVVGRKFTS